jgi:DNA end-binding protein Ku
VNVSGRSNSPDHEFPTSRTICLAMRTTWNGSISFGLVTIPVGLAPATKPSARQSDISFRQLHRECGTPIKQKKWCPVHDRELSDDEIVRGWEVAKGQFVIVEDADLEAIEKHDQSRSVEISQFVRLEEVDPIYYDRTYFLVPASAEAQRRPYVLLHEAMRESGVAALGRFVLAGKEKLCLIRTLGDALALETLFVYEDVKDHAEIDEVVGGADVKKPELELAKQIISSLQGPFEPEELRSEYRESLRELLEAKLEGHEFTLPELEEQEPTVDLMEALRLSVAAAKTTNAKNTTKSAGTKAASQKTAARKRTAARK